MLGGGDEASVVGAGRVGSASAAFANGVLTHALDFDDTHPEALVHPTAVVVPAALAIGEREHLTGHDVLTAAIAGYEIVILSGAKTRSSSLKQSCGEDDDFAGPRDRAQRSSIAPRGSADSPVQPVPSALTGSLQAARRSAMMGQVALVSPPIPTGTYVTVHGHAGRAKSQSSPRRWSSADDGVFAPDTL